MELIQKNLSAAALYFIVLACLSILSAPALLAAGTPPSAADPLSAGYSEQYTFKLNSVPIGQQSATLVKVDNGLQTWTFTLRLNTSVNGQPLAFQQSGTFVVDSQAHVLSYDTITVTNGAAQSEKIVFGTKAASVDFDPLIPGLYHTFITLGDPGLLVNNLVTPLSLSLRAQHTDHPAPFVIPDFSANYLRQVAVAFKPVPVSGWVGSHFDVYDGTLEVPGQPDSTFTYWLSKHNGEIIRCFSASQKLEIFRN